MAKAPRTLSLPRVSEEGMFLSSLGRYMPTVVGIAFEHAGGQDRFNHWADKNYDEFAKTFLTRVMPKQVEASVSVTVEDLLAQADEADVIEGVAYVVHEGVDPEEQEP